VFSAFTTSYNCSNHRHATFDGSLSAGLLCPNVAHAQLFTSSSKLVNVNRSAILPNACICTIMPSSYGDNPVRARHGAVAAKFQQNGVRTSFISFISIVPGFAPLHRNVHCAVYPIADGNNAFLGAATAAPVSKLRCHRVCITAGFQINGRSIARVGR
jgi:hypothetical protein